MRTNLYWLASGLGLGIGCIWSVFPLPDLVKNFVGALTEILIGLVILVFVLMAMRKSLKGGLWLVVVGIGAMILEYYISHYMFLALLIGIPTIVLGGLFILCHWQNKRKVT